MNKAIAQWNRSRAADIYCCGHFDSVFDGGNFVVNGSMIGYSPFAVAIKATYEPAAQVMVAIRNSGNTCLERSSSWIELPLPVPIGGGKLGDGLETLDHLPIPEFNPGAVTVRED